MSFSNLQEAKDVLMYRKLYIGMKYTEAIKMMEEDGFTHSLYKVNGQGMMQTNGKFRSDNLNLTVEQAVTEEVGKYGFRILEGIVTNTFIG